MRRTHLIKNHCKPYFSTNYVTILFHIFQNYFIKFPIRMYIQVFIDVASKLRQLIEQLFQIMLSEHPQFLVRQIVWAKVQKSQAWPAKIVRKFNQHGKTVYKLNFFGDPSYCYLHSHSLSPFKIFETNEQHQWEHDLKLKRAIQLARFYFSKQQEKISCTNVQSPMVGNELLNVPISFEQTQFYSKENIDLPQKIHQAQPKIIDHIILPTVAIMTITPQNVIHAFDYYEKAKNGQVLENLKRKQIISFQNDLKQNLLLKYKLHAVEFLKQTVKAKQSLSTTLKEKRTLKKETKKLKILKFDEKQRCLRKIHKMLVRKGIDRQMAQRVTLKIMDEIEKASVSQKSKNNQCFKENLVRCLYQISSNIQELECIEMQYIEKQLISYIDIELSQNKLEEGSRTTQMCQEFVI